MHPAPETDEPRTPEQSSRRNVLKAAGGAGAAGALAVVLAACGSNKVKPTPGGSDPNTGAGTGTDRYGAGDLGIARYALTIEYIEADFYKQALSSGKLKGRAADLARRFGQNELQHVQALEG